MLDAATAEGGDGTAEAGAPEAPSVDRPRALGLDILELLTLGYVFGILVLWSPMLNLGLITPRVALAYIALGPGLVALVAQAITGSAPARWAVAFLAWACVASVASELPRVTFLGSYGTDLGWIFLASYLGAWALGVRLSPRARRLLIGVFVVALAFNALAAIAEAIAQPVGDLALENGRVRGLLPNTLFLAGILTGGLALVGYLTSRSSRRGSVILGLGSLAVLAAATNLSGSRTALVGGFLVTLAATVVSRRSTEPAPWRTLGLLVGAVAAALVVGVLATFPIMSDGSGGTRVAETSTSSGFVSRSIMWRLGADAVEERPLVGWGPGRFREATGPRTTAAYVRAEGPDKLFYEAHNVVVETAVTTGIVGLLLLGGFVVSIVRRSRGPLAWFGGGVAMLWLTNPVSVSTAPAAMLALGAAATASLPRPDPASPFRRYAWGIGAVLAVIGLIAGVNLLRADALLDRAVVDGDVDTTLAAHLLLPRDSTIANMVTQAYALEATESPSSAADRKVVEWANRTVELEPTRVKWWTQLGNAEVLFGEGTRPERFERAEQAYERGLELSPWSVETMIALRIAAYATDDEAAFNRWTERLCEVDICDLPKPK